MTLTSLLAAAAALSVVVSVIVLGGRFAPLFRIGRPGGGSGRLGVVGSLSLDPRRRLFLVRCDDRFVLLLAGQQDQVVGWIADPVP